MTKQEQQEAALRESDRMRMDASLYDQMGFRSIAQWLRKNADAALRWAAKEKGEQA